MDDSDDSGDEDQRGGWHGNTQAKPRAKYGPLVIWAFGVTRDGQSVALEVRDFTPFFYVRVPDPARLSSFCVSLKKECARIGGGGAGGLIETRHYRRKDFWGFTGADAKYDFVRLAFGSIAAMRVASSTLIKRGMDCWGAQRVYESNIDPLLRFFHVRNIEPAGWVRVPASALTRRSTTDTARQTTCQLSASCSWSAVNPQPTDAVAPLLLASFDLECNSAHGDFPAARKDYRKMALDLEKVWDHGGLAKKDNYDAKEALVDCIRAAMGIPCDGDGVQCAHRSIMAPLRLKNPIRPGSKAAALVLKRARVVVDDVYRALKSSMGASELVCVLNGAFEATWPVRGDEIIQIGLTVNVYGQPECCARYVYTLGECSEEAQTDAPEACSIRVRSFQDEAEMLLAFVELLQRVDPDVVMGYNIFGFDMAYMHDRALDLLSSGDRERAFMRFGRIRHLSSKFVEQKLSSSALGDNDLRYIEMTGRVMVDLMKTVQRDHRLDSYRLDAVASHFLGLNKHDVSPKDIFRLQRGSAQDRRIIAEYCVQDCELCNRLAAKLQLIANNMGMANVCSVPLAYIFMRGQGIKILSLVAKQCRSDGLLIPTRPRPAEPGNDDGAEDDDGYEGAIVLDPQTGMYLDTPVSVLDYNSLYPSSMISHNLSHDSLVLDVARYGALPGVDYMDVAFDTYEGKGDKKRKTGQQTVCRFVQGREGKPEPAVLPRILQRLLTARKDTRKRMGHVRVVLNCGREEVGALDAKASRLAVFAGAQATGQVLELAEVELANARPAYGPFEQAVLDGLQLAYKVTANSLYGQMGARTSALYLKEIAACTTAVGREMILQAKAYVEGPACGGRVIYGDSVAGYTPVLVRLGERGEPLYCRIDQLAEILGRGWAPCLDAGREGKEACELSGVQTWTASGWARLDRVIRHELAPHKRMLRVVTGMGIVDVTDDHSLIRSDGRVVAPTNLRLGDQLLHASVHQAWRASSIYRRQQRLLEGDQEAMMTRRSEAFLMGMYFACGREDIEPGQGGRWQLCGVDRNPRILQECSRCLRQVHRGEQAATEVVELDGEGVLKGQPAMCSLYAQLYWMRLFRLCGPSLTVTRIVPSMVLSAPWAVRLAFWHGMKAGYDLQPAHLSAPPSGPPSAPVIIPMSSHLSAATIYALTESLGITARFVHDPRSTPPSAAEDPQPAPAVLLLCYEVPGGLDAVAVRAPLDCALGGEEHEVTQVRVLPPQRHVYDLSTSNRQFAAGVGRLVVHNTDSIFVVFKNRDAVTGRELAGQEALASSIAQGQAASKGISPLLRQPHHLEYEKTMFPLILLSKKRYVGLLYEDDAAATPVQKSMGIALKRRDYAPIVKKIYGGVLDILLGERDVPKAVNYLRASLLDLAEGRYELHELVISKTLRAEYKAPDQIAHCVLARRMFEQDPGSAPQVNDRIPYVFVESSKKHALMGERIEHVDWVERNKRRVDVKMYIEHQIQKPCTQLLSIALEQVPGYERNAELSGPEDVSRQLVAAGVDERKARDRLNVLREREVERLIFEPVLNLPVFRQRDNRCGKQHELGTLWGKEVIVTSAPTPHPKPTASSSAPALKQTSLSAMLRSLPRT